MRRRRVLAIASGGGHWVQLLRLRPAFEGHDVTFATVHAASADEVPGQRFFHFTDASRKNPLSFPRVAFDMLRIVLRVRPHVIVTTGAAPPLFALFWGRLTGARTLWIDSVANSEVMSGSGEIAGRLAHRVLTQWPHLARADGPEHWGSVL